MYGILRFGVDHTSMLATPEIAQCLLGEWMEQVGVERDA